MAFALVKGMTLWLISFLLLFLSFPCFSPVVDRIRAHLFQQKILVDLKMISFHLRILKESLESGLVPSRSDWEKTADLPAPWGPIFHESLNSLRSQGAPILPSLERMLINIEEESSLLMEARTRSSQAFGQVLISVMLVPVFGFALYFMLPDLADHQSLYFSLLTFCLLLVMLAFYWMLVMMEDARFGLISKEKRTWLLSSKLFFERMVAGVAGGMPPDLAWTSAIRDLERIEPNLISAWGVRIWDQIPSLRPGALNPVEESIVGFGIEIRRTVQQSLTEGTASLDRLDGTYRNFLSDTRLRIQRELQVLPNYCMKPLFVMVLPAVMLLLFGSMGISFMRMLE
jgi:hypothetical protein